MTAILKIFMMGRFTRKWCKYSILTSTPTIDMIHEGTKLIISIQCTSNPQVRYYTTYICDESAAGRLAVQCWFPSPILPSLFRRMQKGQVWVIGNGWNFQNVRLPVEPTIFVSGKQHGSMRFGNSQWSASLRAADSLIMNTSLQACKTLHCKQMLASNNLMIGIAHTRDDTGTIPNFQNCTVAALTRW